MKEMKTNLPEYLPELLTTLSKDVKLAAQFKDDFALKTMFKCAFDTEYRFTLPDGAPPFKPAAQPIGMTRATLRQEMKRMVVFTKFGNVDKRLRREQLFVQLLEDLHPSEAKLLIAMKDQQLDTLYPKITAEFVKKYFPDVLPEGVVVAEPAKKLKVKSAEKVD
jgi:hypothetical protein